MRKLIVGILTVTSLLLLASCGQKQAASTKQSSQTPFTKPTTPQTPTDKLLKQVSAKVPEDSGTQTNGSEVTYSQFYQQKHHWYWRLTSAARGTIAKGRVQSLKSVDSLEKKLTMVDQGSTYTLNFQWLDSLNQAYKVQTDHLKINGDYVLCDAQVPGKWTKGAPTGMKGTWETALYASKDKQYPYVKTNYTITDDSKNGVNTAYKADKKTKQDGAGWGANENLQYKKLGTGVYMLKSYNGQPDLTKAKLANGKLTINYQAPAKYAIPTMHRVGDAPTADQADGTSSSSSVDTNNLTTAQVKDWVWRHFSQSDLKGFTREDYSIEPDTDDDGVVQVEVRENHDSVNSRKADADPQTSPVAARYEIDAGGRLIEIENDWAGHYGIKKRVVATTFDE